MAAVGTDFDRAVGQLGHDSFETRQAATELVEREFLRDPNIFRVMRLRRAEDCGCPEAASRVAHLLDEWAAPLVRKVTWEDLSLYPWIDELETFEGDEDAKECLKFCDRGYPPSQDDFVAYHEATKMYAERLVRLRLRSPDEVKATLAVMHVREQRTRFRRFMFAQYPWLIGMLTAPMPKDITDDEMPGG